jgi:hypothetical protein
VPLLVVNHPESELVAKLHAESASSIEAETESTCNGLKANFAISEEVNLRIVPMTGYSLKRSLTLVESM